jgi:hypothetical protein
MQYPPFVLISQQVQGGGEVDLQRLYSLRLEDAMPHHAVKLSVAVVLLTTKEVCVCWHIYMLVLVCKFVEFCASNWGSGMYYNGDRISQLIHLVSPANHPHNHFMCAHFIVPQPIHIKAACAEKQQQAAVLRAALNETSTDTSNSELNEESDSDDDDEEDDEDGAGHWGERARVILECSVDEFGDLVQNVKVMRLTYIAHCSKKKSLCTCVTIAVQNFFLTNWKMCVILASCTRAPTLNLACSTDILILHNFSHPPPSFCAIYVRAIIIIIIIIIVTQVCFARLKRVVRALRSAAEKRIKVAKLSELKKAKHQAKRSQVISAAGKAAKGLFSRKSSSDKIKGSDGGSDDEEATDEGELGEGEEQDEDDEDEREGNEAIAALSGSGAVVDDLIERAFLSCVHTRVPSSFTNMNPLTLDYRAGTAAAFSALGLGTSDGAGNDNDDGSSGSSGGNASGNTKGNAPRAYRDSALERDVGFALETVLDGDETAVDAATFERAVWVHCRRKVYER